MANRAKRRYQKNLKNINDEFTVLISLLSCFILRKCNKCEKKKYLNELESDNRKKFMRGERCYECYARYHREYSERNTESVRANKRRYVENHRELHNQRKRDWRIRNKDKEKAYGKWYRETFKDKNKLRHAIYYQRNKTQCLLKGKMWKNSNPLRRRIQTINRRARLKWNGGKHTKKEIMNLLKSQNNLCVYCRCNIENDFQIDHIIPVSRDGSNSIENIQLTCAFCNQSKNGKTHQEYLEYLTVVSRIICG